MEGVKILSEIPVYDSLYSMCFGVMGIVAAIIGVICIFNLILAAMNKRLNCIYLLIIGCMCFYGSYLSFLDMTSVVSHMQYKVVIDDNVNFNEFVTRYEIIHQEGEIYTVREKGDMNE